MGRYKGGARPDAQRSGIQATACCRQKVRGTLGVGETQGVAKSGAEKGCRRVSVRAWGRGGNRSRGERTTIISRVSSDHVQGGRGADGGVRTNHISPHISGCMHPTAVPLPRIASTASTTKLKGSAHMLRCEFAMRFKR